MSAPLALDLVSGERRRLRVGADGDRVAEAYRKRGFPAAVFVLAVEPREHPSLQYTGHLSEGTLCSRDFVRCSTAGSSAARDRKPAEPERGSPLSKESDEPRYLAGALSWAQRLQSGSLPVPRARLRSSMLLPSMQRPLS